MSSESESEETEIFQNTPPDLQAAANAGHLELLPSKSRELYLKQYDIFIKWLKKRKTNKISENTLLAYFFELKSKYQPSSLWSKYSMLKATIVNNKNINISNFSKLIAFLKQVSSGYESKKAKVFTEEEVNTFLTDAPNNKYLVMKVSLIMGLYGGCRTKELVELSVDDVVVRQDLIEILLKNTKNKTSRTFYIKGSYAEIVRTYMVKRPSTTCPRFFLKYVDGKCLKQPIGKNTLGSFPTIIATYLKLTEPDKYTGHSFRRTGTTIFANQGANMVDIKKFGGWKSATIAESYVDDSAFRKKKVSNVIDSALTEHSSSKQPRLDAGPSTSYQVSETSVVTKQVIESAEFTTSNNGPLELANQSRFTFSNVNFNNCNVTFK